ncbi:aminodeoxychorismate synthase component I [Microbacterium sp. NPDC055903]
MPAPIVLRSRLLTATARADALFTALTRDERDLFWLDAGPDAASGWSILGTGTREEDAAAPGRTRVDTAPSSDPSAPPFHGGWVGWQDYESGARAVGAPVAGSSGTPAWVRVDRAIAVDHARDAVWALAAPAEIVAWSREVEHLCATASSPEPRDAAAAEAVARHSPADYAALIERCRDAIRAGSAYQLCLTTRFTVPGEHDPVQAYLRLRAATPAHHGGFIRIGERALLSASPELFLRTEGGRVSTRPIKGTRPRAVDPIEDAALATELVESTKERAENVMIVDLMRNDLSRICEPGSVRVDGLWEVESYPAVHQLVSTVSGRLGPGITVADLWSAAFPAGSMTGAPKLSAMAILHGLEQEPRGVYSGCFGHIGLDGTVDLAMVIRSVVVESDEAWIGAGGGITWRSDAAAEVAEVATKARAPLGALGAVLPDAWLAD